MSEIHNQREIEQLQSEIARLEHEKRSAALDWMAAAGQYEDEIARLRSAVEEIYKSSHQVHIIEIARAALEGK